MAEFWWNIRRRLTRETVECRGGFVAILADFVVLVFRGYLGTDHVFLSSSVVLTVAVIVSGFGEDYKKDVFPYILD